MASMIFLIPVAVVKLDEHLELYDRSVSHPEGMIDLKLANQVVKMEDQIAAEVERRLKKMTVETQTVAQVQPAQTVSCEICNGPHQTVYCFATPQQIEEIKFLKQNNPYSNTYNPGWKNHPNFSWKDQQQVPQKAEWEVAIERLAGQCSQFQEETRNNHRNTTTSIKNLEVQVGQIAQHLTLQAQGTLPSSTVANPKNQEKINVVTTRSRRVAESEKEKEEIDDPMVIEVDLEIRENPKEPEVVVPPVKPIEEKNKKDAEPVI